MNSPGLYGTPLLPTATLVAAACFLAGALSSASMPTPVAAFATAHPAGLDAAPTEIAACERARARSHSECVREAEGKALIRHAEWVAALEESAVDGAPDGAAPTGEVIVLRAQRPLAR